MSSGFYIPDSCQRKLSVLGEARHAHELPYSDFLKLHICTFCGGSVTYEMQLLRKGFKDFVEFTIQCRIACDLGCLRLTSSITLYDPTYNFTPNPINRYAIGDRTTGLKTDSDGGLTIYIQSTSPGEDKESNWLPSTTNGLFILVMRTYMPGAEIVEQKWAPPPAVATAQ